MEINQEILKCEDTEKTENCAIAEEEESQTSAKQPFSQEFLQWESQIKQAGTIEEKIESGLIFMKGRLASHPPKFREFWEAKKRCLPFFKEALSVQNRADLWQQYVDLSVEARRLKNILEEESSFACEQIELAIGALLRDIDSYKEKMEEYPALGVSFQFSPFSSKQKYYEQLQKELHFLSAFAVKINALRKETIKTDMRARTKNAIFQKLSPCAEKVFPERRTKIKEVSREFLEDITVFAKTHFGLDKKAPFSLHSLREEVKSLQVLAKKLMLPTQAFLESRSVLSSCWDQLKMWDKEKKKEAAEKKAFHKKSYEDVLAKVEAFEKLCVENPSLDTALKQYEEILLFCKEQKDLEKESFIECKKRLLAAKRPLEEKVEESRRLAEKQKQEKETVRRENWKKVREEIVQALANDADKNLEALVQLQEDLQEKIRSLHLSSIESMMLQQEMRKLEGRLLQLKKKSLLSSLDGEKQTEILDLLQEKKQKKQAIKMQLEAYRQALGSSGFDFEKAMMYRELIEAEKQILEDITSAIQELEEKLYGGDF